MGCLHFRQRREVEVRKTVNRIENRCAIVVEVDYGLNDGTALRAVEAHDANVYVFNGLQYCLQIRC